MIQKFHLWLYIQRNEITKLKIYMHSFVCTVIYSSNCKRPMIMEATEVSNDKWMKMWCILYTEMLLSHKSEICHLP